MAHAKQAGNVWRVGFVAGGARPVPFESGPYIGFVQGMRDLCYVDGKDFVVEWRFAERWYELFPDFAAEFSRLGMDVIVTGLSSAIAAMPRCSVGIGCEADIGGSVASVRHAVNGPSATRAGQDFCSAI